MFYPIKFYLIVEIFCNRVVQKSRDGVENSDVDTIGYQQEPVARVGAKVLD